jgi:hypothetical protein
MIKAKPFDISSERRGSSLTGGFVYANGWMLGAV